MALSRQVWAMWRSRLWLLYWVRTTILKKPALTILESAKSMRRYVPPKGTAGLARSAVSGNNRLPSPPARTMARTRMVLPSLVSECEIEKLRASVNRAQVWQLQPQQLADFDDCPEQRFHFQRATGLDVLKHRRF